MGSRRPLTHSASSSSSSPPTSASTDGPEIHFGDVGPGVQAKPGGSTSSRSVSQGTPPKKARGADGGGGGAHQPPRCQVEGCNVDLSEVKTYYLRHKVCGTHSKAATVVVRGLEQRFCQQCSRSPPLGRSVTSVFGWPFSSFVSFLCWVPLWAEFVGKFSSWEALFVCVGCDHQPTFFFEGWLTLEKKNLLYFFPLAFPISMSR